jgi:signal transduction histidine kinase
MTKILLVDDRDDNLLAMESLLNDTEYECVKANSGREALKILLTNYDFALILMDVKMPNLDGYETATLIYEREKLRHIPIIFITAYSVGEDHIFKGYQAGAVDYIYKPINSDLVRTKVAVFAELYKKNQQLAAQSQKLIAINKSLEEEIKDRINSEEKVKGLNLQLIENINKIEEANRNLDRFAFIASHDLQEPLRKIRLFCGRLKDKIGGLVAEDVRGYLERIDKSANRMQVLIQDILTFSKLSIAKKDFVRTDLNIILDDILLEHEEDIKRMQARITVDKIPEIESNPNLMQPLFSNIITNALKYSKKDTPPVIHISSEMFNHMGNPYCRILFEDNGIGFEQKYANQIFDIFTRLHPQNEYEGTGVGLALCKKIVDEHGGFISAVSTPGQGSTFIVSMPAS